ncbi:unnamed protein product [Cylindrotheca closterium]|uniref:FAS1 domain-containing protein n=1 Tax=Cylindrotheca closterium TaxID=2856 RepID=A0AAD2FJ92_9STRA|nr:unnamed protein product [Cylindrotheca closterium]
MKTTITLLALALGAASAADFTSAIDKGIYTSLLQLVNDTDAEALIDANAPLTIFGPKDAAFSVISSLLSGYTIDQLRDVLLDHVVAGVALDSAAIVEQVCTEVETVGGLKLAIKFEAAASSVTVNNIPVTDFNMEGDFGIMHGIEGVFVEGILGQFEPCPKPPIFDPLVAKGAYSTLIDLLIDTGSVSTLESNAPMTIFGPKDSAFAAISEYTVELSLEEVQGTLLNHVILGEEILTGTIISEGCIERVTAGGLQVGILFDSATSSLSINGVTVSDFNVNADFGIFQGIDQVMVQGLQGEFIPCPPFEADFSPIRNRGIYNALLNSIESSGADIDISASAPVTILGPNDIAFADVANIINGLNQQDLKDTILRHAIVGETIEAADIVEAGCLEKVTAGGLDVAFRYNQTLDQVDVNGIIVSDIGIVGDYGLFHGIQGVLFENSPGYVPCPAPTFVDLVEETGNYTGMVNFLLTNAQLQQELARVGPVTIFGPDDAAFAAVSSDLAQANNTQLVTIIGGHVVQQVYTAEQVVELGCVILRTVIGTTVRIMYIEDEGAVMVNDAKVILPNIQDETSIFHGIDKVIDSGEQFDCPQTPEPTRAPTAPVIPRPTVPLSSAPRSGLSIVFAASIAIAAFVL